MDLTSPWLAPLQPALGGAWLAWQAGATVAEALNLRLLSQAGGIALDAGALRFVPPNALPPGEAYEAFIHRTASVPTRDNLHDFFNGQVWLAHPLLKRRLNALQAGAIARHGIAARRGALRDALTLFDENGALLQAPPTLWRALCARDWHGLFVTHRGLWGQARLTIVGHALLEQLATAPRKPLTAHVLLADPSADLLADPLALDDAAWAAKPFAPLPVLGVPGWWAANELPGFYNDPAVFRPPRGQAGRKPSIDR